MNHNSLKKADDAVVSLVHIMAPYIKKIVFVYVMAAVLTSHVDSPQRDASGSNSNKRTDQTNFLHNEHPWE